MNTINDGGPAFPFVEPDTMVSVAVGMSLRDYFAAKALQGLLAGCPDDPKMRLEMNPQLWALASYKMADAMLVARGAA